MYKSVYREKSGRLTIRERSYTLILFDENYTEANAIPVPIERMGASTTEDRLSKFVRNYLVAHPATDVVDRLTKA